MNFEEIKKLTSLFIKDVFGNDHLFNIDKLVLSSIDNFSKLLSILKIDDNVHNLPLFIKNYPLFENYLDNFNINQQSLYSFNEKYINKLKEIKFGESFITIPKQRRRSKSKIFINFSYDSDIFNSEGEICKTAPENSIKINYKSYISSDEESITSPHSFSSSNFSYNFKN
jgi:hypothetical protein